MKIAIAVVLLAAQTACATVPAWKYDSDEQRYKEGSALHAYGAGFVVSGISGLAGGLGLLVASTQVNGMSAVPGGAVAGVGGLFLLIGGLVVGAGNDRFTPPPSRRSRSPQETDAEVWSRARSRVATSSTAAPRRPGPVCCDDRGPWTSDEDCVPCTNE